MSILPRAAWLDEQGLDAQLIELRGDPMLQDIAQREFGQPDVAVFVPRHVLQKMRDAMWSMQVLPSMRADCRILQGFVDEVRHAGYTHALLLGLDHLFCDPFTLQDTLDHSLHGQGGKLNISPGKTIPNLEEQIKIMQYLRKIT